MRAVTIRDTQLIVEEHPDPAPGDGRGARPQSRRPASTAPTCTSASGATRRRPGSPQDIPGLELAGEVVGAAVPARSASSPATG